MSAREEILARTKAALRGAPQPAPRPLPAAAGTGGVDLLEERIRDYEAEVHRVHADAVAETVERICRERGWGRVGIPAGLRADWRPAGVDLVEDAGLTPGALDRLDAVVTGSTLGIAETGTIVLSGAPDEGRRALTLVPDVHVCVVCARDVVPDVPAAFSRLRRAVDERRPLTFVSGPSATSDIELSRVEGVHGPRTLVVLVVTEQS
jgi:L-lactate dehydrogenase complex protein LldG